MKVRLQKAWDALRASYWFVPSLMVVAAFVLAETAVRAETPRVAAWLREAGWLYLSQPEGARALLSTVAGSMITVAGVTFSMTILAISHASGMISPRLLTDFMRDRGTQFTLGTFIATFLYCLLVLRTVHGADAVGTEGALEEFVPQIAVFGALLLAVLSVGVLIYFIHHIPAMLSMAHLIERVSGTLMDRIRCLYPEPIGNAAEDPPASADLGGPELAEPDAILRCDERIGYLQYVDEVELMQCATALDLVVELVARPGDFVGPAVELARLSTVGPLEDADRRQLLEAFVCGAERTAPQDVLFPCLQLVEVAVRALSPGTNDPYSAVRCIDHLGAAIHVFAARQIPDPRRMDSEGTLRVLARAVTHAELTDTVFDGLRPHVVKDATCTVHLLREGLRLAASARTDAQRATLLRHIEALQEAAEGSLTGSRDLWLVRQASLPATA